MLTNATVKAIRALGVRVLNDPAQYLDAMARLLDADSIEMRVLRANCDAEFLEPFARAAEVGTSDAMNEASSKAQAILVDGRLIRKDVAKDVYDSIAEALREACVRPAAKQPQDTNRDGSPSLRELLYFVEHQFLRDVFYETPADFMPIIARGDVELFLRRVLKRMGIPNPFEGLRLRSGVCRSTDDMSIVLIEFPDPPFITLCHRVYLVADKGFRHVRYFTIERGYSFVPGEDCVFLCAWEGTSRATQQHVNYGHFVVNPDNSQDACREEEVARIAELFSRSIS